LGSFDCVERLQAWRGHDHEYETFVWRPVAAASPPWLLLLHGKAQGTGQPQIRCSSLPYVPLLQPNHVQLLLVSLFTFLVCAEHMLDKTPLRKIKLMQGDESVLVVA
jgi:hypothetical protein